MTDTMNTTMTPEVEEHNALVDQAAKNAAEVLLSFYAKKGGERGNLSEFRTNVVAWIRGKLYCFYCDDDEIWYFPRQFQIHLDNWVKYPTEFRMFLEDCDMTYHTHFPAKLNFTIDLIKREICYHEGAWVPRLDTPTTIKL